MDDEPGTRDLATPTLMRSARGVYSRSIRAQLHAIGANDLPRNGAFILAGMNGDGQPIQDLPADMGISQQAAIELLDIPSRCAT